MDFYHFNNISHLYYFTYSGWTSDTSTLIIMDLHGILQIGVDLYNKLLGNTYVKSLPHLC